MSFLTDEERDQIAIRRMIFHVVGRPDEDIVLLKEIEPPLFPDFFLARIKGALGGNLFEFAGGSGVAEKLGRIATDPSAFTDLTQALATDFQKEHSGRTSQGVFFVFELDVGNEGRIYALIKYDNDEVVRYSLDDETEEPQVPFLERFQETFVKKREALQKIALIRLTPSGGQVLVRDRSRPTHISEYFENYLRVRRVHAPADMSAKLLDALKETFRECRDDLSETARKGLIGRLYDHLGRKGQSFDPENSETFVAAIFGTQAEGSKVPATLRRCLKVKGIADEAFEIDPDTVKRPERYRMVTNEGVEILYDAPNKPKIEAASGGRSRIIIDTSGLDENDVYPGSSPRRR